MFKQPRSRALMRPYTEKVYHGTRFKDGIQERIAMNLALLYLLTRFQDCCLVKRVRHGQQLYHSVSIIKILPID